MVDAASSRWFSSAEGMAALWGGVLAGPIAWALDLGVSYALVKWTCGSQHTSVLHLVTVGALVIIAGGAFAAWRALEQTPAGAPTDGGHAFERGRFMAIWGLWSCAFFTLVVLATALPPWVLDACQ
jgi:hypothetical protein